jgi:hypothetical protein
LKFFHYGHKTYLNNKNGNLDMRGVVALLTRNIKIVGEDVDGWGFRVLITKYKDFIKKVNYYGFTELHGVELFNGGQLDTLNAGIDFRNIVKNTTRTNLINGCSLHKMIDVGIGG